MTWQQKAAALNALKPIALHMRDVGDWYVHQSVEIKEGGVLKGEYGNGATPEFAIEDHWDRLVENLPAKEFLVINAGNPERRRHVRWNGYMWADVPKE